MIEKLTMEKETVYMSLETGEVVDTHAEGIDLYREGHRIQILYHYRYNGGEWEPFRNGPTWEH